MTSPNTLLKAWRMRAKKKLGQHFLAEPATANMIAQKAAIKPYETVLEIGAGLGALTIPLARLARQVHAVEKDPQIAKLLQTELIAHRLENVDITCEDILKYDMRPLTQNVDRPLVVMGNLPYNISSQILVKLIDQRALVSRAVLMIQKELAQRICATPGGRDYGRLTVMLKYCADIRAVAEVSAAQFAPPPKVASTVVLLHFFAQNHYDVADETFFFRVIKAAFSQRRKTLKNALAGSDLHLAPDIAKKALEKADIDPRRRAETLAVEEFVRLNTQITTLYKQP